MKVLNIIEEDHPGLLAEVTTLLERENIVRALEASGWRVAGKDGAAQLLGMKPTTLTYRLKALGLQPPVD